MSQKHFDLWLKRFMDGTARVGGAAPDYTITFEDESRILSSFGIEEQQAILVAQDAAVKAAQEDGEEAADE